MLEQGRETFGLLFLVGQGTAQRRDVGKGNDHPVDLAPVPKPIGQDAQQEVGAARVDYFPLDHFTGLDDPGGIGVDRVVGESIDKIRDRAADVVVQQVELPLNSRRKFTDAQVAIHEDGAHIRAFQQIVQIGIGQGQFLDFILQLRVDGV